MDSLRGEGVPCTAEDTVRSWQPSTPASFDWQADCTPAMIPELRTLNRRRKLEVTPAALRVSALDAGRLDMELTAMLYHQFSVVFSHFQPRLIGALQPELNLLLDFLIFRFSVWRGRPTPGSALMNLRYRDERRPALNAEGGKSGVDGPGLGTLQRVSYGLAIVGGRYVWARLSLLAASQGWSDAEAGTWRAAAATGMRRAEMTFKLATLANLLTFLRYGTYRSVIERLLGARLVMQKAVMGRALSFEYLNRQLVWHELSELMLFVLPLMRVTRLKRLLQTHLPALAAAFTGTHAPGLLPESSGASPSGPCTICGVSPQLMPYEALPCHHRFCYYCLRSETEADPQFRCPSCRAQIVAMRRISLHLPSDSSLALP